MNKKLILGVIISLSLSATAFADTTTSAPKAYWRFDERSGIIAHDSSLYGNDLEGPNSINWTAGQVKSAVSMNGLNNYLKSGPKSNLDLPESFTIVTWINSDILPQQNYSISSSTRVLNSSKYFSILTKGENGKRGFELNFKANYLNLTRLNQGDDLTSTASFDNSHWQQLAVVWDSKDKTLSFYKDGLITDSMTVPGGITAPTKDDKLVVGSMLSNDDHMFSGYFDEMRVYDTAISGADIKWMYAVDAQKVSSGNNNFISQLVAALADAVNKFLNLFR